MELPALDASEAHALAGDVLGERPRAVDLVPAGWAGQNWRLETASGAYVMKVGPAASAAKWSAARIALDLASTAGVPVPRLVHFSVRGGVVVRALEWIDGVTPDALAGRPDAVRRFGTDLGTAIAALHGVGLERFTSRLDGSGPAFPTWGAYVDHRLTQIRARSLANATVDRTLLDRSTDVITVLARDVTDVARPALCHRDLYADNLLVGEDGDLRAVLDWDMAEAWDAAGDWFKLDWLLHPALPGTAEAVDTAYRAGRGDLPRWEERKRLVDVMEALNTVANAVGSRAGNDFTERARARLEESLSRR